MRTSGFVLPFKLFGTPIRLDATFVLLVALLTWLIGGRVGDYVAIFRLPVDPAPLERGVTPWLLGFVAAFGLVVSVLLHELAHALVARRFGVQIREIRLWLLGGVAEFDEMPTHPGHEALVAVAGPLASIVIGAACWLAVQLLGSTEGAILVVLAYLATVNVILAIFNMLPALPMDGGRVLRALLARQLGHVRATRVAAGVSRVTAILMGVVGLVTFNLILVAIAVFVHLAGQAESQVSVITDALHGLGVQDLMTREVETVGAGISVAALIDAVIAQRHVFFPVVGPDGGVVGTVRLQDLQHAPLDASVADVMNREVATIELTASAADAFKQLQMTPSRRLVVVDASGAMVGLVSSSDLLRILQVRMAQGGRTSSG